jgi:hypothetical protein
VARSGGMLGPRVRLGSRAIPGSGLSPDSSMPWTGHTRCPRLESKSVKTIIQTLFKPYQDLIKNLTKNRIETSLNLY